MVISRPECYNSHGILYNDVIGDYSDNSLDESGIESNATSTMSTLGSSRSATLRAPTTPHAIRQKPPPKPPRLSTFNSSLHNGSSSGTSTICPPSSPGGTSSKSSFGDITLDSSFCSNSVSDLQPVSRIYPCSTEDKVYHIVLQTKEFLVNELDVQCLLSPLLAKGVLDTISVKQLRNTNSKTAMAQLLLDMLMGKSHSEFLAFCDVLRLNGKCGHLADLLLALDGLVDLGSEDTVKKRQSGSYSAEPSGVITYDSPIEPCPTCLQNNGDIDDLLMDTTNFDVEILYIDKDNGQIKPQKEVAVMKLNKLTSVERTAKVPDELVKHEADRYIPVITVGLYNYCLWDIGMEKVCKALHNKTCVRELSLSKCHLGLHSVTTLTESLQLNQGVFKLDLRLNNLTTECTTALCDGLKKNASIKVLNLSSTGLTSSGCAILLQSICRSQCVSELDIGFNDLVDEGCEVMAKSLATNCPLKRLRMRDNSITFDGAFRLFKALKKNSRLNFLDISSNTIGNKALVTLSEILRYNRSLKQMNLENCGISSTGCQTLARALKTNTVLKQLNLNMNPIGDEGVEGLAEGLRYNQVLDVLCLNMCDITNVGFSRLLESLQFNMSLKTLKLCYNKIGRTCLTCQRLDWNKNHLDPDISCHGDDPSDDNSIPSIEDIYDKLCQILQQNQDLKVLLWGNKLDDSNEDIPNICEKHAVIDESNEEITNICENHAVSDGDMSVLNNNRCTVGRDVLSNGNTVGRDVLSNGNTVGRDVLSNSNTIQEVLYSTEHTDRNTLQQKILEQYTIQPTLSINTYTHPDMIYSSPSLSNGGANIAPLDPTIHNHYASDMLFTTPLNISVQNTSALSCGNVFRPQVSPRMGTTAAVIGSHSCLQSDSSEIYHPRIRTNGSLPRRHKHTNNGNIATPLSNGGVFEVTETESDSYNGEDDGVFRPHTFPRKKKPTAV